MGTRANRRNQFFRLGRCKDENHMRRRFFDDFQKRIRRTWSELVRLIDDVNLVATLHWGEKSFVAKIACVIYKAVRRCIKLDDIQRPRTIRNQILA